eukprot:6082463-Amphidinium_carterae.1
MPENQDLAAAAEHQTRNSNMKVLSARAAGHSCLAGLCSKAQTVSTKPFVRRCRFLACCAERSAPTFLPMAPNETMTPPVMYSPR